MKTLNNILLTVTVSILSLTGCATKYQQYDHWSGGGFTEIQLDKNAFKVSFVGNGYTGVGRAETFALLRSAELTLKNGYAFFQILDEQTRVSKSTITLPTETHTTSSGNIFGNTFSGNSSSYTTGGQTITIAKPSTSNTIVMFKERPSNGLSYNARYIYKQYQHYISETAKENTPSPVASEKTELVATPTLAAKCIAVQINEEEISSHDTNPDSCYGRDGWQGLWEVRFTDGQVEIGQYVDGKEQGPWEMRFANGTVETHYFVDGESQE